MSDHSEARGQPTELSCSRLSYMHAASMPKNNCKIRLWPMHSGADILPMYIN